MNKTNLKDSIAATAIKRREDGFHIVSPEGNVQDWIIDLRETLMHSDILAALADRFWDEHHGNANFQIVGLETASIPLLTAILLRAPDSHRNINASFIRKSRKSYGLGRFVEGRLGRQPVVLIDDVVNSGDSISHALRVLSDESSPIAEVFCVVDYCNPSSREMAKANKFHITPVFKLNDFGLKMDFTTTSPVRKYERLWVNLAKNGNFFHVVPKSEPIVSEGYIYRGCDDGKMQAFSADTGDIIWEFQAKGTEPSKGIWSTPAISGDYIYFGAYNGVAYCIDRATGKEIWSVQCGDWIGSSPLVVAKHNLVYFGVEYSRQWANGSIAALDMMTGELMWHHPVARLQHGSPTYWKEGDLVVWGTADYEMLGIHAGSGEVAWAFSTERSVKCAPFIDETKGMVAFASFDSHIYVLDVSNGSMLGRWKTSDVCYTTPLIHNDRLYCGSGDGKLYVISLKQMAVEEIINIGSRVYSAPRLIGERIMFGANCGRVFAIHPETLQIEIVLMLADSITNALGASNDGKTIYISTNVNHLYGYKEITQARS